MKTPLIKMEPNQLFPHEEKKKLFPLSTTAFGDQANT